MMKFAVAQFTQVIVALCLGMIFASSHADPTGLSASKVVRYTNLPTQLCLKLDANTAKSVTNGDIRLQLQLRNRAPIFRYSRPFHLILIDGDLRHTLHTFGMHVDHVKNNYVSPQRFLFNLRNAKLEALAQKKACFEIAYDLNQEKNTSTISSESELEIALSWKLNP